MGYAFRGIRWAILLGLVAVLGAAPFAYGAMSAAAYPLNPPTWYHGDHWEWTGPMGNTITVEVASAATNGTYQLVGGAAFAANGEWGALLLGSREQVGNFLFLDWPLSYNKKWQDVGSKYVFAWRAGPVQSVTVPAGTFSSVELLCSVLTPPAGNPPVQHQMGTAFAWYAPSAKTIVKIQFGPETAWPATVRNKSLTLTKYTLH